MEDGDVVRRDGHLWVRPCPVSGMHRQVEEARSEKWEQHAPLSAGWERISQARTHTQRSAHVFLMERSFTRPIFFNFMLPLGPGEEDKGF